MTEAKLARLTVLFRLKRILDKEGSMARRELIRRTHLPVNTIKDYADELISAGFWVETTGSDSHGGSAVVTYHLTNR